MIICCYSLELVLFKCVQKDDMESFDDEIIMFLMEISSFSIQIYVFKMKDVFFLLKFLKCR